MAHTQTISPNHLALRAGKQEAHFAEAGAMISVFKISGTEHKPKQKLLKCKRTVHIAIFNVKTLNRRDQLLELTASAFEYNIDIVCGQEYKYCHSEVEKYHDTGNGWTFISAFASKDSVSPRIPKSPDRENTRENGGSYV